MKIDFDMLEKQVAAGMPAKALLIYFRTQFDEHEAARVKKRPADAKRTRARRQRDTSVTEADTGVTPTGTPSETAEQELFAVAKRGIGKRCGGLVSSLIRHHNYDLAAARRVVDIAITKSDPREYVVASMRTQNGAGNSVMAAADRLLARAESFEFQESDCDPNLAR